MFGSIFLLLISLLCVVLYISNHIPSIICIFPIGLAFLLFGLYIKNYYPVIKAHSAIIIIVTALLLVGTVYLNYGRSNCNLGLSSMCLGYWPLYILSCCLGSFFIIALSTFVFPEFVQQLGRNSMYYYGLHYCVIWIVDSFFGGLVCAIITLVLTYPLVVLYKKAYTSIAERI